MVKYALAVFLGDFFYFLVSFHKNLVTNFRCFLYQTVFIIHKHQLFVDKFFVSKKWKAYSHVKLTTKPVELHFKFVHSVPQLKQQNLDID